MTSLTQVAITARKIIRYGIFFIIFLLVGRILLSAGISIYRKIFPAPPPKPTLAFGKLPAISFPAPINSTNFTFTLETVEGDYPKLASQAKVFFMLKPSSNLLSLETAKARAEALGFDPNAQQVSQTVYRFPNQKAPSNLEVNIVTGAFSISYDLKADPSPINQKPPFPEIAASNARSFLSSANLLPIDLTGTVTHEFLKAENTKFVTALSQSEAKLVKINLFRKSYDNLPCLTQNARDANVWFMISGLSDKSRQIVAAEYHYFPVDETQFATYPIKTGEAAWSEFTAGKGHIAKTGNHQEGDSIKIRKIYLAYYDPGEVFDFLEPVIVFDEGTEDGFIAYIPAVTPDYYSQ